MILTCIEKWCKDNDTSICALEKKCGIGNGTISRWNESMPRVDTLQKVSEATGISISELIGSKEGR